MPRPPRRPPRETPPDEDNDPDPAFERAAGLADGLKAIPLGIVAAMSSVAHAWWEHPVRAPADFTHELIRAFAPVDPVDTYRSLAVHGWRFVNGEQTLGESLGGFGKDVKQTFLEHSPISKAIVKPADELSKLAGLAFWGGKRAPRAQGQVAAATVVILASFLLPAVARGLKARLGVTGGAATTELAAGESSAATARAAELARAAEVARAAQAAEEARAAELAGKPAARPATKPGVVPGDATNALAAERSAARPTTLEPSPDDVAETSAAAPTAADAPTPEARGPPQEPSDGFAQKISPETPRGEAVAVREAPAPKASCESAAPAVREAPAEKPAHELPGLGEDAPTATGAKAPPTPEQVSAWRRLARKFYEQARALVGDLDDKTMREINNELAGIDYSKKVEAVKLEEGQILYNYKQPGGPAAPKLGEYFADDPELSCDELGVNKDLELEDTPGSPIVRRVRVTYKVKKPVTVLKSTAARVCDWWSVRDRAPVRCSGGGTQYYFPRANQADGAIEVVSVGKTPVTR